MSTSNEKTSAGESVLNVTLSDSAQQSSVFDMNDPGYHSGYFQLTCTFGDAAPANDILCYVRPCGDGTNPTNDYQGIWQFSKGTNGQTLYYVVPIPFKAKGWVIEVYLNGAADSATTCVVTAYGNYVENS